MPTIEVRVRRFSVVSSRHSRRSFNRLTATIGHPEMSAFRREMAAAENLAELEKVVHAAIGSSELMEFVRFDAGDVLATNSA